VTFKNRDDIIVAPGLSLTAVIEYLARDEQEHSDVLTATIDGCPVEIPIRASVFLTFYFTLHRSASWQFVCLLNFIIILLFFTW